ncbi:hypothetical protein ACJ41O_008830 [Fusarium nematophilum]
MSLSPDVKFGIAVASICGALILFRCGYRLFSRCKSHASCHRTWHADDAYMAFALLPLAGRTTCIAISFILNPAQVHRAATQADAAAQNLTVAQLDENHVTAYKLLIPSRICYALFLWCLKLCLLSFYSRFVHVLPWGRAAFLALWWFVVVSFLIILIPTLTECRPLYLRLPLILLFCVGGFVVIVTIIRLPMILNQIHEAEHVNPQWASIEVLCACIVANTAFFYALFKDIQRGHDSRVGYSRDAAPSSFYMQSIRSTSRHVRESHTLEDSAFDDTAGLNGRPISIHSVSDAVGSYQQKD